MADPVLEALQRIASLLQEQTMELRAIRADRRRDSISLDEAAERHGISRRTVERLIASGKLQARRVGKRTLLSAHDLDDYMRSA